MLWGHKEPHNDWSSFPPSFKPIIENVVGDDAIVKPMSENEPVRIENTKYTPPTAYLLLNPE